jgi:hypothetical protein
LKAFSGHFDTIADIRFGLSNERYTDKAVSINRKKAPEEIQKLFKSM